MDTGILNVLHDTGNKHLFPVAKSVHIHFHGVFNELINKNGMTARYIRDLINECQECLFIKNNTHGASAKNIGRTDQDRISHA